MSWIPNTASKYSQEYYNKFLCFRRASTERTGAAHSCGVCRAPDQQHAAARHQVGERPLSHPGSQGRRPCPGRHQGGNIHDILVWIRIRILLFSSVSRPSKFFCLLLLFESIPIYIIFQRSHETVGINVFLAIFAG
jgi:hypothetical protein